MRGIINAGLVALVAGLSLCSSAWADRSNVVSIKGASGYFASNYSDGDNIDPAESPNVKAMGRFSLYAWKAPVVVKGWTFDPEVEFEWRAVDWPIGGPSSSINENNYLPGFRVLINENDDGHFRGAATGWGHQSTGTGDSTTTREESGALDKILVDTYWALHGDAIKVRVRGWYTVHATPEGIKDYMNFNFWDEIGGEITISGSVDFMRAVATFGLTSQDIMAFVPLADPWNFEVFGQLHNGEMDGLLDYTNAHTSGGVGVAISLGNDDL